LFCASKPRHFEGGTRARIKPNPLRICGLLRPKSFSTVRHVMCCVPEMRMSNAQAKLASAVLIGFAASIFVTAPPLGAARAADNSLTVPGKETPNGKHWYYRIERGSGRHCWYQRGDDEAPARIPEAEPVAAAAAPQTAPS